MISGNIESSEDLENIFPRKELPNLTQQQSQPIDEIDGARNTQPNPVPDIKGKIVF